MIKELKELLPLKNVNGGVKRMEIFPILKYQVLYSSFFFQQKHLLEYYLNFLAKDSTNVEQAFTTGAELALERRPQMPYEKKKHKFSRLELISIF